MNIVALPILLGWMIIFSKSYLSDELIGYLADNYQQSLRVFGVMVVLSTLLCLPFIAVNYVEHAAYCLFCFSAFFEVLYAEEPKVPNRIGFFLSGMMLLAKIFLHLPKPDVMY